jgi:hypothetical protein
MTSDWPQLIGSSFVSFMLSFMLMKAWLPFAPKRPGTVQMEVHLTFLQRVLIHRSAAMLLMAYVLVGSLPGLAGQWFIPGTQVAATFGLAAVLFLPLRYVFTDYGVGLNNGVPRPYKSFRRFDVRHGKRQWLAENVTFILRARKASGSTRAAPADHALYIPRSAEAEVTRFLKKHVR